MIIRRIYKLRTDCKMLGKKCLKRFGGFLTVQRTQHICKIHGIAKKPILNIFPIRQARRCADDEKPGSIDVLFPKISYLIHQTNFAVV